MRTNGASNLRIKIKLQTFNVLRSFKRVFLSKKNSKTFAFMVKFTWAVKILYGKNKVPQNIKR